MDLLRLYLNFAEGMNTPFIDGYIRDYSLLEDGPAGWWGYVIAELLFFVRVANIVRGRLWDSDLNKQSFNSLFFGVFTYFPQ